MKPALFHPAAELEMIDAATWYEAQQENLGKRFLTSIQDTINRLKLQPHLYSLVRKDVRRCLTKTFPFEIITNYPFLHDFKPHSAAAVRLSSHVKTSPAAWHCKQPCSLKSQQ